MTGKAVEAVEAANNSPATLVASPALVILIGPSGAGKSTWAAAHFEAAQIVSSDDLRAVVGENEFDQKAGTDAFEVLELIVARRVKRQITTVVDTVGLDADRRAVWLQLAAKHRVTTVAAIFETPAKDCRARNKTRARPVPAKILTGQIERLAEQRPMIDDEGFDHVIAAESVEPGKESVAEHTSVRVVPAPLAAAAARAVVQREQPTSLGFGLQLSSFDFAETEDLGLTLAAVAVAAEEAGFQSIWVMDHFRQIPQVGREWDPMLESWTTLAFLAAATSRIRLGTLVSGITYRNVGHLAKIIATLDVLSGGRAIAGLGAAWFEQEHRAFGWEFPGPGSRLDLLEDALQALPLLWGPGTPRFDGATLSIPQALCYPRPIQDPIPILVGGGGERRTLALVAKYAQAANLFGEPDQIARKLDVLRGHCDRVGRSIDEIEITQLGSVIVAEDGRSLADTLKRIKPVQIGTETFATATAAGTIDDHIGRFRALADVGVDTAIVSLGDLADPGSSAPDIVTRFAPVIDAFRVVED